MKRINMKRMAVLGAFALGLAAYAGAASAATVAHANYELDSDVPMTIGMDVSVQESVSVATTGLIMGTLGIHQAKSGTNVATMKVNPDSTTVDTHTQGTGANTEARIILEGGIGGTTPAAATVAVTGAFPGALIYEHIENVVDLTCQGAAGTSPCNTGATPQGTRDSGTAQAGPFVAPTLSIVDITDDLATGGTGGSGTGAAGTDSKGNATTIQSGHWTKAGGAVSDGIGVILADGSASWDIGGTIATVPAVPYYASGTYAGSFDITLSY